MLEGHGWVGFSNVIENTFDTMHLFEGKVAQESAEALRGIHSNGVETAEPCFGCWASRCKISSAAHVLASRGLTVSLGISVSQHLASPLAKR